MIIIVMLWSINKWSVLKFYTILFKMKMKLERLKLTVLNIK